MHITYKQFKATFPRAKKAKELYSLMEEMFPKYDINTLEREAGFLSQAGHESIGFSTYLENMNYSETQLKKVFRSYFRDVSAKDYARQPEKIASYVYGNRMGNGGPETMDGWKFRGHGFIQLTGRDNHEDFARYKEISIDESLAYLQTLKGALEASCWFWKTRGLNELADTKNVRSMTLRVNGGTNGLADRVSLWNRLYATTSAGTVMETLSVGDRGENVAVLQKALGISPDGVFGPKTKRAVKAYQQKNGLVADGIAGPATLGKLFG
jgi:putative chitinase